MGALMPQKRGCLLCLTVSIDNQIIALCNDARLSGDVSLLACLHDKNKSGFFGGPAFIQPIRTI